MSKLDDDVVMLGVDDPSNGGVNVKDISSVDLFYELLNCVERDEVGLVKSLLDYMCVTEVVQLDPRQGAPSYGLSPLHTARSYEMALVLLEFGVPVDVEGCCRSTPLIAAAKYAGVLECLLKYKADVKRTTRDGTTALHHAVLHNSVDSVQLLINAGADVNAQDLEGNSPLHMVGSVEIARVLVASGAEIDLFNNLQHIPLEEAVNKGGQGHCLDVASYLLDVSHESQSRTKQLLDVLGNHVLAMATLHHDQLKEQGDETIIPVHTDFGHASRSHDEEKVVYEETEDYGTSDKWKKVKDKIRNRRMEFIRLKRTKTKPDVDIGSLKRARFAEKSRMFSSSSSGSFRLNAEFYSSFFELMVSERPELALKILDKQRQFLFIRHGSSFYSYSFDLTGSPLRSSNATRKMVQLSRYSLLAHPVVQWQITAKYIVFTRYLLFYEFFATIVFGILIVLTFNTDPNHLSEWWNALSGGAFAQPTWTNTFRAFMMSLEIIMQLLNLRFILNYFTHWKTTCKRGGIKNMKRKLYLLFYGDDSPMTGDWFLIPHVLVIYRDYYQLRYHSEDALVIASVANAVSIFILAMRTATYAEGLFEEFGLTTATIRKMFMDCKSYFVILFLCTLTFSFMMSTMYNQTDVEAFNTIYNAFITLFFFVFNLDLGAIQDDPIQLRRIVAFVCIGVFEMLAALTLLNLIIAVMTNSFEQISQRAREQNILNRAKFVIRFEDTISFYEVVARYFGWIQSRCGCSQNEWMRWEKEQFRGRKVLVKEHPDGKVLVATNKQILQYFLQAKGPCFFFQITRFYELFMVKLGFDMPFAEFSWRKSDIWESENQAPTSPEQAQSIAENLSLLAESTRNYDTLSRAQRGASYSSNPDDTEFDLEKQQDGQDSGLILSSMRNNDVLYLGYFNVDPDFRMYSLNLKEDQQYPVANSHQHSNNLNVDKVLHRQEELMEKIIHLDSKVQKMFA